MSEFSIYCPRCDEQCGRTIGGSSDDPKVIHGCTGCGAEWVAVSPHHPAAKPVETVDGDFESYVKRVWSAGGENNAWEEGQHD